MTKKMIECECGAQFSHAQQTRHRQGEWHKKQAAARELRARGLSFAEIARQLGFTRAYVSQRFAKMEVAA